MESVTSFFQPFFDWLGQTTLTAGIVICLILAVQKTLGGRLGPRWCHALWLVLLVRMVLPWAPSSRFSLANLISSRDRQVQVQQLPAVVEHQEAASPAEVTEKSETASEKQPQSGVAVRELVAPKPKSLANAEGKAAPLPTSIRLLLPILWLAGTMLVAAYILVSDLALWRIVKRDRPLMNQQMLELFEDCKAQMGIQSLVVVVPSSHIRSPGLFGFIRPRLLLPKEMLNSATQEEMRYVFLHELAHLKRHDIYLGWLASLLQILHWFNPLVWFAFYRMRADRELACDALVLTQTGQDKSREYGGAILGLVRRFSRSRPLPAMAGIMESKSQLKRRISMITKFRNKSYRFSPLAAVLIIILAFISIPDAKNTKASETHVSSPANQPKFTKIQIPNKIPWDAQLSPDGKNITFVNEKRIWIMPRLGRLGQGYPGVPKLLDTAGLEADWCGLTWSADGRWIAFNGKKVNKGNQCIYIVSADGGKQKQVYENNRDVRVVNYRMSLSPHGETLAFTSVDANELHIYTLAVNGGRPKKLIDAQAREPVFSPDGKMIAYVEDKDLGHAGGGLWVVPAVGGTPTLVAKAGNASTPVWSPDGTKLAFVDYYAPKQIHIVPVTPEGNTDSGKVTLDCPEGFDEVRRLTGWMPDNQIGTILGPHAESALYAQPIQGGMATILTNTHGIDPEQPRWSPDGKRIICTINAGTGKGKDGWVHYAIASVPAEGGEIKTIPIQLDTKIATLTYGGGNHISPDGRTIVFAAQRRHARQNNNHIWTVPIEGGRPKQLTNVPTSVDDWYPCWSPDGRHIAFVRVTASEHWDVVGKANIYVISAEGGESRQITSESNRVFSASPVLWSPNGKLLSYFSRNKDDASDGTIKVISPDGGEPRVVARIEKIFANKEMAWSPDSKRIAYNAPDNKIKIVSLSDGSIEEIQPDLKDMNIFHLDWSPDGKTFAFGGYTGGGPEFWMMENFLPKAVAMDK